MGQLWPSALIATKERSLKSSLARQFGTSLRITVIP